MRGLEGRPRAFAGVSSRLPLFDRVRPMPGGAPPLVGQAPATVDRYRRKPTPGSARKGRGGRFIRGRDVQHYAVSFGSLRAEASFGAAGGCAFGTAVYGATMSFALPDGLPPGRFLSRGPVRVWVSDEFPQDVERLWPRLLNEQRAHGLVPILCWPDAMGRPLSLDHVDAVRLEDELATDFAEYRRRRLPFWTDPTPVPVPEGIELWPHDPGPPFEQWPGLAPEMPATSEGPTPREAASGLLAGLIETGRFGLDECRLVLVPAHRSSDALALIGWSAEAPLPLLCALLRSWEDRFGAQVVAVFGSELHVSVVRPPVEAEYANLLALDTCCRLRTTSSMTRPRRSPSTRRTSWGGLPGRSGGTRHDGRASSFAPDSTATSTPSDQPGKGAGQGDNLSEVPRRLPKPVGRRAAGQLVLQRPHPVPGQVLSAIG